MTRSVAVVGAGLTGASAAWRLAQRGEQVTLFERSTPANAQGSSHGSARIFRYAYPDPFYASLVAASRDHWDELQELTATPLIRRVGSLDFGSRRRPAELAGTLNRIGVEHTLLTSAEAAVRWPGISFDTPVLWTPDAGVIDAESTVRAMIAAAAKAGATVLENHPIMTIFPDKLGVRIDDLHFDHAVIAAGGWLPELLVDLPHLRTRMPPLRIRKEQAYHFPYRTISADWPTVIHKRDDIMTYSLPGGRDAGFRGQKLAEYNGGPDIASAAFNDGVIDPGNRDRVIAYVERHLPGLVPEPFAETTCVFTTTPTEDFVIDTIGPITVASPCSGHGAKFAPLLGKIIADAVTGVARPDPRFRLAASGR